MISKYTVLKQPLIVSYYLFGDCLFRAKEIFNKKLSLKSIKKQEEIRQQKQTLKKQQRKLFFGKKNKKGNIFIIKQYLFQVKIGIEFNIFPITTENRQVLVLIDLTNQLKMGNINFKKNEQLSQQNEPSNSYSNSRRIQNQPNDQTFKKQDRIKQQSHIMQNMMSNNDEINNSTSLEKKQFQSQNAPSQSVIRIQNQSNNQTTNQMENRNKQFDQIEKYKKIADMIINQILEKQQQYQLQNKPYNLSQILIDIGNSNQQNHQTLEIEEISKYKNTPLMETKNDNSKNEIEQSYQQLNIEKQTQKETQDNLVKKNMIIKNNENQQLCIEQQSSNQTQNSTQSNIYEQHSIILDQVGQYVNDPLIQELTTLFNKVNTQNNQKSKYQGYYGLIFEKLKEKKYYLKQYLTSGGEGDIFLGYQQINDESDSKNYIFKILFKDDVNQEEVDIMKSFETNINTIQLIEVIKINTHLFIFVLEQCQCSLLNELNEIIVNSKEFTIEQLLQIIFDLLDGLIQLRIYEILHLDIKPSNILKTLEGAYVFTDFGISSKFKKGKKIQIKGQTDYYASQEQRNNQTDQINYKSDIFSLGKTLIILIEKFRKVNQDYPIFTIKIEQIIRQNMIQTLNKDRKDIRIIHQLFFQLIIDDENKLQFSSFLHTYYSKIEKIKNLFRFDAQKDVIYFQDIQEYYSSIQQIMLKPIEKFIEPNNNIFDHQLIKELQLQLKYKKQTTEKILQLFQKNSSSIPSSLQFKIRKLNSITSLSSKDQYKKYFTDIQALIDITHYDRQIASSLYFLGQSYQESYKTLKYAKQFNEIVLKLQEGNRLSISSSLQFLAQIYKDQGDSQSALKYTQQSLKMKIKAIQQNYQSHSPSQYFLGNQKQGQELQKTFRLDKIQSKQNFTKGIQQSYQFFNFSNYQQEEQFLEKKTNNSIYFKLDNGFQMSHEVNQNDEYKKATLYEEMDYQLYNLKQQRKNFQINLFEQMPIDYPKNYIEQSDTIFNILERKNYYLMKYLASGCEGDTFLGFQQNKEENRIQEYAFKFYWNYSMINMNEEISIMKSFEQNINTIQLIDGVRISENLFILVQEKCQCSLLEELEDIEKNKKQFSIEQLFQIIFDLLDGLIQLKVYNILHLDIKPTNILKTQEGNYVYTDFSMSSKIKKGQPIIPKGGTYKYSSQEQKNNQNVDFLSDVQSLGKTLIEVIQVYNNKNQNNFLNESFSDQIRQISNMNMDQDKKQNRENIKNIHLLFFQLLINNGTQFSSFLNSYYQKIVKIKNLSSFDSNKNLQYFQDILLYYTQIELTLLKSGNIYQQFSLNDLEHMQNEENQINNGEHFLNDPLKFYDAYLTVKIDRQKLSLNQQREIHNQIISSQIIQDSNCQILDKQKQLLLAQQNLNKNLEKFGRNNSQVSSSLLFLSQCFKNFGDSKSALKYALQTLDTDKYLYQGDHPQIASTLLLLGQCYYDLKDFQHALVYAQESLNMFLQLYELSHPQIASSLQFLSQCYLELKDPKLAFKYAIQSLDILKQIKKGNDPLISYSLYLLGQSYQDLGDEKNGIKYAKESLQISKQFYNGVLLSIATSFQFLGECYLDLEYPQYALQFAQEALEIRKEFYQDNHTSIASSLQFLSKCYSKLGDVQNTLKYIEQSLEIFFKNYNDNQPQIACSLQILAKYYNDQRDSQKALKYAIQSLEICQQLYLGNHPQTAQSLQFIGECFQDLGFQENALKFAQQSLQMYEQLYKENHPLTKSCLKFLEQCQKDFGSLFRNKRIYQ